MGCHADDKRTAQDRVGDLFCLLVSHATVEKLRGILKPKRERYDLTFTMNRWAELVQREDTAEPHGELENDLVAYLVNLPSNTPLPEDDDAPPARKRRRVDPERYAALLLAVIHGEYTRAKPTRITRSDVTSTSDRDHTAPFYRFAHAAFEAIGWKPSEDAIREATERWDRSRDFSKRTMQRALWGQLSPGNAEAPKMTWPERHLHRRKNSPPENAK